jgi:splicing factor 3B subunit 3
LHPPLRRIQRQPPPLPLTPQRQTTDVVELSEDEAAFSACTCTFAEYPGEQFLIVGTGKGLKHAPRSIECGFFHVYRVDGPKLTLMHKVGGGGGKLIAQTQLEDVPYGMACYKGRLIAGVRNCLRVYELGKKKLLRKCENKSFPNVITSINVMHDRIYVTDVAESFHFVRYKRVENVLYIYADDCSPRWVTAGCILDYDTVAGVDKFGSLFVCRLPAALSHQVEDDPTGGRLRWDQLLTGECQNKVGGGRGG